MILIITSRSSEQSHLSLVLGRRAKTRLDALESKAPFPPAEEKLDGEKNENHKKWEQPKFWPRRPFPSGQPAL